MNDDKSKSLYHHNRGTYRILQKEFDETAFDIVAQTSSERRARQYFAQEHKRLARLVETQKCKPCIIVLEFDGDSLQEVKIE